MRDGLRQIRLGDNDVKPVDRPIAGLTRFVEIVPVNQHGRHDDLRFRQVIDARDIEGPSGRAILLHNVRLEWQCVSRLPTVLVGVILANKRSPCAPQDRPRARPARA